jgi:hypothetical protein
MTPAELMDAIERLLGVGLPDGVTIHRQALSPIEKDRLPAIVPYILDMKPKYSTDPDTTLREYNVSIRIECRALGVPIESALWPMMRHVQRVMLSGPLPLDGHSMGVEEMDIQYDAFQRDKTYCAAAMDYRAWIVYGLGLKEYAPTLKQVSYESAENEDFMVGKEET